MTQNLPLADLEREIERLSARTTSPEARATDWFLLGQALLQHPAADSQRRQMALMALVLAYQMDASCAPALLSTIGQTAFGLRAWSLVEEATSVLLQQDATDVNALMWRAAALQSKNEFAEAERLLREVVRLRPDDPLTHHKLALSFKEQGRFAEAEAGLRHALALEPDNIYTRFDLSELELYNADYAAGWPRYEVRVAFADNPRSAQHVLAKQSPYWQGESLAGKVLVVYGEQGLGDCLWAVRFLPLLAQRARSEGGRVIFGHDGPLRHLIERMLPDDLVLETSLETHPDFHCGLMSLPLRLGVFSAEGWGQPYLSADPERAARWRERVSAVAAEGRPKVGLVWNGNPGHIRDARRSMAPEQLEPLLQVPGVTFFALSPGRGSTVEQWRTRGMEVIDLTAQFETGFDDVAALLVNLDLVVTIDSGPAHLAGALGVPTCLMIDYISAWFWGHQNQRTPWYDSIELLRQPEIGAWAPVLERVRQKLVALASSRPGEVQ